MKISTMKKIDRWLGYPACGLLGLLDLIRPERKPEKIQRILVIKFWGMGSLILSLPVFKALREVYPEAELGFATLSRNRSLVELLKISDRTIYLDLRADGFRIFFRILKFFFQLYQYHPQLVIDLEYLTRFSALASYLSGAGLRVGFHSWDVWRGELHNLRVPFNPYWHASKNFLNLVSRACGKELEFSFNFSLPPDRSARQSLDLKLKEKGIGEDERILVVNPNASTIALERRWPPEYFVRLIKMILEENLGKVILIGADDEREFVQEILEQIGDKNSCFSLAGELEIKELVELLRRAELLITNDSGPLHLSSLAGTKTVSFFGPETPQLFGPLGEGHTVLYLGIDCSPCITVYNAKTVRCLLSRPECLYGITPQMAFEKVKEALGR